MKRIDWRLFFEYTLHHINVLFDWNPVTSTSRIGFGFSRLVRGSLQISVRSCRRHNLYRRHCGFFYLILVRFVESGRPRPRRAIDAQQSEVELAAEQFVNTREISKPGLGERR